VQALVFIISAWNTGILFIVRLIEEELVCVLVIHNQ